MYTWDMNTVNAWSLGIHDNNDNDNDNENDFIAM